MTVHFIVTFDDSSEKEFDMTEATYTKMKGDIRDGRRAGTEATITLGLGGGGEFLLPWGKVKFAESFLIEEGTVSRVEPLPPVEAQVGSLQLVKPKSVA